MSELNSYSIVIRVSEEHLDDMDHVNNVVYLQWVQDAAEAHWLHKVDKDLLKNTAWVVSRHEIDYKKPALLNDELVVTTWVEKAQGVTTHRNTEIHNRTTGDLLIRAKTIWCFIDPKTKRPARLTDAIKKLFL